MENNSSSPLHTTEVSITRKLDDKILTCWAGFGDIKNAWFKSKLECAFFDCFLAFFEI